MAMVLVRNSQDDTVVITNTETGVSEDIVLPASLFKRISDDAGDVQVMAIPEGVDITSRYHYLVN